jgi:hypothetical protein
MPASQPAPHRHAHASTVRRPAGWIAWILAAFVVLHPSPASAGPHTEARDEAARAAVLETLTRWVARDRGTEVPALRPRLVFLPPDQLRAAYAAAQRPLASGAPSDVSTAIAFFDQRRSAIVLPGGWSGADPVERSILVHELVHHFQFAEAERFACAAAREKDAYAAQERYLAEYGLTLQGALDVDPLFHLMTTNCMF